MQNVAMDVNEQREYDVAVHVSACVAQGDLSLGSRVAYIPNAYDEGETVYKAVKRLDCI